MEVEKYSDTLLFGVLDKGSKDIDYGRDFVDPAENSITGSERKKFATIENIDSCIAYIEKTLEGLGFSSRTGLTACPSDAAVLVCNLLYALLQQKNEDTEARSEANDQIRRLESEKKSLHVQLQRAQKACESKEREIKELSISQRKAAAESQSIIVKLRNDRDEARRIADKQTAKETYFQTEMRKKDRETKKLQEKLHSALMEKKKDTKTGIEIINSLQRDGGRSTWTASKKSSDDDFTKLVVEAYEARQRELIVENGELRASLRQMQDELRDMFDDKPHRVPSLREATAAMASLEPESNEVSSSNDVFNLPYGIAKDEIEERLRERMKNLFARTEKFRKSGEEVDKGQRETPREKGLKLQLEEAKAVISKQKSIMNKTLTNTLRSAQSTVDSPSQTDNFHFQPTATRASHTQTESSDDDDDDDNDIEREQRDLALEMKLRHVEEEREAAELKARNLEVEWQDLDQQKQMLEEEQAAFKSALKKWAPGLGAGQFLSDSITRSSEEKSANSTPTFISPGNELDGHAKARPASHFDIGVVSTTKTPGLE